MMSADEVKKLIQQAIDCKTETDHVEFKDARGGMPSDVWQAVSAFSHRPSGGHIIFGVKEDRPNRIMTVVGVTDVADLQEKVSHLVSEGMSSVIRAGYVVVPFGELVVLSVYIPPCQDQEKPCYFKRQGMPGGAYVRDGNTNRKITDEEMRRFLDDAKPAKFDSLRADGVVLEDLSNERVQALLSAMDQKTRREVENEEIGFELYKNLGIADTFPEGEFPTVAGFLLFAKDRPQLKSAFSRYAIRCVRYAGSNVTGSIIDKADIDGVLSEQIDEMQKFILRNIKRAAKIVGTKRVESYEYPEKAIREIIANAVIHRDYRITETYTQVNIFDDRMEVFNPGCLPPGVTVENIRDAQFSRNPIIAARLKDLDYLEEYGRGINIVFSEMEKWALLPPLFKNSTNSFKVILPGEKLSRLNDRQLKIWNHVIMHKRITAGECGNIFGAVSRATINNDLSLMQELGLIRATGKSIHTSYEAAF